MAMPVVGRRVASTLQSLFGMEGLIALGSFAER